MSKVQTLIKLVVYMKENPKATNAEIASAVGISEIYLKECKNDVHQLAEVFWKQLLDKNDVDLIISKLDSDIGIDRIIINKFRNLYPEEKDGLIRMASNKDKTSAKNYLSIGFCGAKGDNSLMDFWLEYQLYDILFRFYENGSIDYRLATECENMDGYSKWRIKLRDDLHWSDGKPVCYDDILYTFSPFCDRLMIKEIEKISENEIAFVLLQDNPIFQWKISSLPILPSHCQKYEATNGPFRMRKRKLSNSVTLYKNKNYYRAGYPKLDSVKIRMFQRTSFAIKAVMRKEIDVFFTRSLHEVRKFSPSLAQSFLITDLSYWLLLINKGSKQLKRERKINQLKEIIDYGAISSYISGTKTKDEEIQRPKIGSNLRLGYLASITLSSDMLNLFKFMASCAGVKESNVINVSSYDKERIKSEVDLVFTQFYFGYGYSRLKHYFHSKGDCNVFGFSNSEIDSLLDKLDSMAAIEDRKALGKEIVKRIQQDNLIILLSPCYEYAFSNFFLDPSPKVNNVTDFIINLSSFIVEQKKVNDKTRIITGRR
jgi:ABC-type transport system substrate-binding protein